MTPPVDGSAAMSTAIFAVSVAATPVGATTSAVTLSRPSRRRASAAVFIVLTRTPRAQPLRAPELVAGTQAHAGVAAAVRNIRAVAVVRTEQGAVRALGIRLTVIRAGEKPHLRLNGGISHRLVNDADEGVPVAHGLLRFAQAVLELRLGAVGGETLGISGGAQIGEVHVLIFVARLLDGCHVFRLEDAFAVCQEGWNAVAFHGEGATCGKWNLNEFRSRLIHQYGFRFWVPLVSLGTDQGLTRVSDRGGCLVA